MKILMTSESYFPRIGGAEVHVNNLFIKLKQDGHYVTLITNEPSDQTDGVIRLPWSGRLLFGIFVRIWKESENVSLIHSHYSHRLAMLSSLVGRIRRIPVVVTLHGMGILDLPNSGFVARVKHGIYRYTALKLCTHVISTSDDLAFVADRYIKRDKITIVMNGYDSKKFTESIKVDKTQLLGLSDKFIIMSVRRLVPKNGPHYLIETMPKILRRIPNAHYVVVGDGPLRSKMEDRVKELNIVNSVSFLGMINNDKVVDYLREANVVVFPSTAESSSIACAEAMGMGKMIVASKVGGLVELLGENEERGCLVNLVPWTGSNYNAPETLPESSYQKLAEGIIQSSLDNDVNINKKYNALTYARTELSWDAIYTKTVLVYKKFG